MSLRFDAEALSATQALGIHEYLNEIRSLITNGTDISQKVKRVTQTEISVQLKQRLHFSTVTNSQSDFRFRLVSHLIVRHSKMKNHLVNLQWKSIKLKSTHA